MHKWKGHNIAENNWLESYFNLACVIFWHIYIPNFNIENVQE